MQQEHRVCAAAMTPFSRFVRLQKHSLAFFLLIGFVVTVWFAGGSSRADAAGQALTRGVACAVLVLAVLGGLRPVFGQARAASMLLAAGVALLLLQLVPLPPAMWQGLPGRAAFAGVPIEGADAVWRPLSLVPGATLNAVFALVVPIVALALIVGLHPDERALLPGLILLLVTLGMLFGLIQASGVALINPLVGGSPGEVAGPFANRNHFALFLAIGCVIAPAWAATDDRRAMRRGLLALGLVMLFILTILATGSRAGLLLGGMGLMLGMVAARHSIGRNLRHFSRRRRVGLAVVVAIALVTVVLLSIMTDRAVSVDRALAIDADHDMRSRGLPTVLAMIGTYFPAGAGFGSFDPLFRFNEPHSVLKPTYFNHAHNDFLEIVLDGGVAGLVLIIAALGWWAWASVRAWRRTNGAAKDAVLPRLGSAILLLLLVASGFDYPARTPMMMVMAVIAAVWLCNASALPRAAQQL